MGSRAEGYDRHITIFSPEGNLFQIEYAFKAVNAPGLTSVGACVDDKVAVCTQKKATDKLIEPESVTRIFNITPKIGVVMTGLMADCVSVVTTARSEATEFRYKYGYDIPASFLSKRLADLAQVNTQYAGRRSMGVVIILACFDDEQGASLFRVDPAGSYFGFEGCAAGQKEQEAVALLEKKFAKLKQAPEESSAAATETEVVDRDAARICVEVLQTCAAVDFKASELEVGVADGPNNDFRKLSDAEVDAILGRIANDD